MREILFRAKTFDTKEWVYGYACKTTDGDWTLTDDVYLTKDSCNENIYTSNDFCINDETIGQFTGVIINGEKVFEGDIIEASLSGGVYRGFSWGNQVVVFKQCAFGLLNYRNVFTPFSSYSPYIKFDKKGNIYDNPEIFNGDDWWKKKNS